MEGKPISRGANFEAADRLHVQSEMLAASRAAQMIRNLFQKWNVPEDDQYQMQFILVDAFAIGILEQHLYRLMPNITSQRQLPDFREKIHYYLSRHRASDELSRSSDQDPW